MTTLTLTTCQAALTEPAVAAIARYLARTLGIDARAIDDIAWQERERLFNTGRIDVVWMCGAPYVRKVANGDAVELLAAPVYAAPRYMNRPAYFSDVMVRRDSPYQSFRDLRGARWAYNNLGSHSGYEVVRYHLATLNLNGDFFGSVVASGAHSRSMEMIASGDIDASAIDTTVFDGLREINPTLCEQLRPIKTLGPSPQPPWVIGAHIPTDLRVVLRDALTHMHEDKEGRAALRLGQLARFAAVNDSDYDDVREMIRVADDVGVRL